jgi:hypothetical protein
MGAPRRDDYLTDMLNEMQMKINAGVALARRCTDLKV